MKCPGPFLPALAVAAWCVVSPARADVKPAPVCGDAMVLQQGVDGRLWGTAEPGEVVTVTFRNREARATTGTDGTWRIAIATGTAGGPFDLAIAGRNAITYTNVLVGEVWLCSGQSNMDWGLNSCDESDKAFAATAPANPHLRLFTTFEHGDAGATAHGPPGVWVEAKPETIVRFSAVALFFGRHIQERLNVPVGLIHASNGGMPIEAFMSPKVVAPFRRLKPDGMPDPVNSTQYQRLIEPLLDCRLRGVIWYQGEGNGGEWSYSQKLPALIEDWRTGFANPDLAFHVVQLPPLNDGVGAFNWARAAQALTAREGQNTGLAVIDECGGSIHPNPKRPAGERLALAARGITYGEKIVFSGPAVRSVAFDGGTAVLEWEHVGGGLVARNMVLDPAGDAHPYVKRSFPAWRVNEGSTDAAEVAGFAICGPDEKYWPARAEIVGRRVVVSSTAVPVPTAVRYGFLTKDQPFCNVFNREGLPAATFASALMTAPLSLSAGTGGTVLPSAQLTVARAAPIGIRATPAADHIFNGWSVVEGEAEVADPQAIETTVRITTAAVLRADFLHRIACTVVTPIDPAVIRSDANLTVSATAAVRQAAGSIRRVEFFADERKIGVAASPPFTCVWERVPAGVHLLSVRATDDMGVAATSPPVCVVATASGSWTGLHAEGGEVSRYVDGGRHWTAHTFTTNGTLRVCKPGEIEYLVVGGGGGGGGTYDGGGGGGGGFLTGTLSLAQGEYAIHVGAGGTGEGRGIRSNGGDSFISRDAVDVVRATGGGRGASSAPGPDQTAANGGSGGGGAHGIAGGTGVAGPPRMGHDGGKGGDSHSAGGGGAGGPGEGSTTGSHVVRQGGPGRSSTMRDGVTAVTYSAGGAARRRPGHEPLVADGASKRPNTGDGGDGGSSSRYKPFVGAKGGDGGSGIVIIRYPTGATAEAGDH